jgi:hypothetical protein
MNYMELVIQAGYVLLFGQCFSLGALFCMISNQIQINISIKDFKCNRRSKPEFASGIGNWTVCLNAMSYASIVSNCAMIFFMSEHY